MLSSNKSLKVVKELLKRGIAKQSELAEYSGVSIGQVNKVVKRLRESFLVNQAGVGVCLRDHPRLLILFSVEYPLARRLHTRYTSPLPAKETVETIAEKLGRLNYAFTLLTALPKYSAAASGETVSLYVDKKQIHQAEEVLEALNFADKGVGPVVEVYEGVEGILYDATVEDGVRYVSREQLMIDLYSSAHYNYVAVQLLKEYLDRGR
jgi:DNA-binding Lrp family transcriptional regulator